jgi:hypothetical protein
MKLANFDLRHSSVINAKTLADLPHPFAGEAQAKLASLSFSKL